jgi:hypothetical protein
MADEQWKLEIARLQTAMREAEEELHLLRRHARGSARQQMSWRVELYRRRLDALLFQEGKTP